jgi:5-methylcytosine-specific restriction endonuclease McrA
MNSPVNKPRKKRSAVWMIDRDLLEKTVKESSSLNRVLKTLGLDNRSASYVALKARLKTDVIDFSHITLGIGHAKGKKSSRPKIPLENVLIIGSVYGRAHLKARLLKEGLLKNECTICGQLPSWNGKPLSLQIDHINGISDDNRLENLRILCPHCHSQTPTFAGRRSKKVRSPRPSDVNPDWRNNPRIDSRKVLRPSKDELSKLVWEKPTTEIAMQFGVSDSAVGKWAKEYGISKPPRGYWQKKIVA